MPGLVTVGGVRRQMKDLLVVDGHRVSVRVGLVTVDGVRRKWHVSGLSYPAYAMITRRTQGATYTRQLYGIGSDGASLTAIGPGVVTTDLYGQGLVFTDDDQLLSVNGNTSTARMYLVEPETGTETLLRAASLNRTDQFAMFRHGGDVYMASMRVFGPPIRVWIYRINQSTGVWTYLRTTSSVSFLNHDTLAGVEVGGQVYLFSVNTHHQLGVGSLNVATGTITQVGSFIAINATQSGGIGAFLLGDDPHILVISANAREVHLYRIDLGGGTATLVSTFTIGTQGNPVVSVGCATVP